MKRFMVSAMVALAVTCAFAMPKGWTDDFEAAKTKAAKEGKLLLVDFSGSDWCGWCMKLDDEVFSKKEFIRAAQMDFVLVMIDSPRNKEKLSKKARRQNPELVKKYGIRGYPTVLVMDAEGNVVARTGYRRGGVKEYIKHLDSITEAYKSKAKQPAKGGKSKACQRPGCANSHRRMQGS